MGDKKSLSLFVFLIVAGQFIFGVGTIINNYWVMFAGRVVFGLGGENNLVVQCFVVEKWFQGRMLSIAFGMVMIFNLAGTMANNFFTPLSYNLTGSFAKVFCFSFIALGFSVASATTYIVLDLKYADKYLESREEPNSGKDEGYCAKLKKQVKQISPTFWFIMLAQMSTSNVYYQFMNFGTSYSQIRFGNTYDVSKNYLALIPFIIMVAMLLLSIFTQVFGQKGRMLVLASILS